MTSKKFLSNKKTVQQTISISPALKEWIKRYVNVNHRKNPNDERFKSISSFYTYIMGNMMELFEKGKTLDDFERVEDKDVKDFFDKFTFQATIPLYEMVTESNKYTHFSFKFVTRFLMSYIRLIRNEFKISSYADLETFFEKIRTRYGTTNVSKDMRLEIFPDINKGPATGFLEFIGKQRNLHFENCKYFAAIFGMLGVRLTDFIYSPADYYCRMDLLETKLLFKKELVKKERLKLLKENVDFMVNHNRILNDKDKYLWMNLAEDKGLFIGFKDKNAFIKMIKIIEEDLRKFGIPEDFLNKILQFFNNIHWIRIENVKDLSFRIEHPIENNPKQKQLLIDYFSQYKEISQKENVYFLK